MKKLLYLLLISAGLYAVLFTFHILPLRLNLADKPVFDESKFPEDTVRFANVLDTAKGNWEIYIDYSWDDCYSGTALLPGKVWKCSDPGIVSAVLREARFINSGADMATVGSDFFLLRDGRLVFQSQIVLDSNAVGFQSDIFGWTSNEQLKPYFRKFRRVWSPLLVIY